MAQQERGANRRQPLRLECIREPSAAASGGSRLPFAMSLLTKLCPCCGYTFRRAELARSFQCLGVVRSVLTCPGCGASVVWSKRPWRMSFGGMLSALALLPLGIAMGWDHSFESGALCWAAAVLGALFVAGIGTFSMRFESVGSANQHLQPTPR